MPQALLIARDMQNQLRRIPAGLRAWMPLLPQTINNGKGYNESDDFPPSKYEGSVCIIMLSPGHSLPLRVSSRFTLDSLLTCETRPDAHPTIANCGSLDFYITTG